VALLISFWVAGSASMDTVSHRSQKATRPGTCMRTTIVFFRHISAHCVTGTPCDATRICWTVQAFQAFQASLTVVLTFAWIMLPHFNVYDTPSRRSYSSGRIVCHHTPRWKGRAPGEYSRSLF
jgi:hypothetical protein